MIGYVGRIAVEKNVVFLAEALARVAAERPAVRFLFVGDGPARGELERRMGPHARFVGYRSGEDLADHYAAADLFAFSSLTETFGNVVLEALASGLPVVALRAGGIGDIVRPGVTGFLLEPDATARAVCPGGLDAGRRRRTAPPDRRVGPGICPRASRGTRSWSGSASNTSRSVRTRPAADGAPRRLRGVS